MNHSAKEQLEFNKIKEMLAQYILSPKGLQRVEALEPITEGQVIKTWLTETTEAKSILGVTSSIPLHSLKGIDDVIEKLGKGMVLRPGELSNLGDFLENAIRMRRFMEKVQEMAPLVSSYGKSIYQLTDLIEEIQRCIRHNRVDDRASSTLSKIRKRMQILEERLKHKLEGLMKSMGAQDYLQDQVVSMRQGRYVLPVKKEYGKNLEGEILDHSNSGSTLFIEPKEVQKLQSELSQLKIQEEQEEYKILAQLTVMAEAHEREIRINEETMVNYDFLFAKAKLSRSMNGNPVELNEENQIHIQGGRHPLIIKDSVPLDFSIGKDYRTLVITGPNTGGKTVALKTVGLLTMMVQSGLHVPVEGASQFAVFEDILVDIGDGQSIEQSLSTFSAHLKNLINIINFVSEKTLVIVDELGAGTDPGEGMGLAMAVLELLYQRGAITLATTHYSEIKNFAMKQPGFQNGCMEFDIQTLRPLYQLSIGKAGESNGFLIALRLGMPQQVISKAHEFTYQEAKDYHEIIKQLEKTAEMNVARASEILEENKSVKKEVLFQSKAKNAQKELAEKFKIGDSVYISNLNRIGIVCELPNQKGEVGVMVMKKKLKINHKRLSPYIDRDELYPEDYDLDIVLETKENRKKKKIMEKKYVKGLTIEHRD